MDPNPLASPAIQPFTKAVFDYVFVTFPYVGCLICLQFLDIVTGFGAAFRKGSANSSASWKGMNKKAITWAVILAITIASRQVPGLPVSRVVITWYILTELLSILENAALCGVQLPPFMVKGLHALREFRANADKLNGLGMIAGRGDTIDKVVPVVIANDPAHPVPVISKDESEAKAKEETNE